MKKRLCECDWDCGEEITSKNPKTRYLPGHSGRGKNNGNYGGISEQHKHNISESKKGTTWSEKSKLKAIRNKKIRRLKMLHEYLIEISANNKKCYIVDKHSNIAGAHRVAKELWCIFYKKKWPKDKLACHTCDNSKCINIFHIFPGTHQDNSQDMVSKNRQAKGERIKSAKLTESEVLDIRQLWDAGKYSKTELARMFNVGTWTISAIITRSTWKHI